MMDIEGCILTAEMAHVMKRNGLLLRHERDLHAKVTAYLAGHEDYQTHLKERHSDLIERWHASREEEVGA